MPKRRLDVVTDGLVVPTSRFVFATKRFVP